MASVAHRQAAALVLALCASAPAAADTRNFTNLDLEQLMALEVTGVTRRAEAYLRSPAAVFVLTGEDLRRSGSRSIAEALRMVPGLFVARSNAQTYAISARGFSAGNSDKLQVLVDGRSVYTPLTSAVFWDVLDTYLADIERIEVIRGPGATVWGANAVNGVINIVTRAARDTQGTQLYAGGGNEEKAFGGFRSGRPLGAWGHGRAYAKAWERDASRLASGEDAPDGQSQIQAGSRIDGALGDWGRLSVSGDLYEGEQLSTTGDTKVSGRNLGATWVYPWAGGGETQTHLYYDGYERAIPEVFSEERDTFDLNLQHNLAPLGRHALTFGAGARLSRDQTGGPPLAIIFDPQDRRLRTYSAFVQDEVALGPNGSLILGSKFEHNDFTGSEIQPGARLGWTLSERFFTWAAVSRAVRTPNRIDHDIALVCTPLVIDSGLCSTPGEVIPIGNRQFDSEQLLAYEWGLRSQWSPNVLVDLALFYNDYDDLRSTESRLRFDNGLEGRGHGGELSLSWQCTDWLGVQAFYSYLKLEIDRKADSADARTPANLEGSSPENQVGLRLSTQPLPTLDVDAFLRYVDQLPAQNVDSYVELRLRVGWRLLPDLELALVGGNLLDRSHPEIGANPATRGEPERSVLAELTWNWP